MNKCFWDQRSAVSGQERQLSCYFVYVLIVYFFEVLWLYKDRKLLSIPDLASILSN